MNLLLQSKTVIVTGGSGGIGAGICTVFAGEGANVVVNYRSHEETALRFCDALRDRYAVGVLPVRADVTKPDDVQALYDQAEKRFGAADILVNNAAGGAVFKPFQEYSLADWKNAQEGIVDHVFLMSRTFLQSCIRSGKEGRIINILSKSAILSSSIHNLTYVANKGALTALTRGMAKEFIQYGVYVNGIVPGYVKTRAHEDGTERTERVLQLLPLKAFALPEEIGHVAAMLASPLFRQMIGAIVDCTGGTLI